VKTQAEFNNIHFFLLGNRFETLFLPSAIVLTEGKCDHKFIERVLSVRLPDSQISIIAGHSDGRIKEILTVAKGLLADIEKSPYRDRIFVVLDSVHSTGLVNNLVAMGVMKENVIVWSKNGIEFCYPPSILDKIFGVGLDLSVSGDDVSRNGLSYRKAELNEKVIALLEKDTPMDAEFDQRFLLPLMRRLGLLISDA